MLLRTTLILRFLIFFMQHGKTALDVARQLRHEDIIRLLSVRALRCILHRDHGDVIASFFLCKCMSLDC